MYEANTFNCMENVLPLKKMVSAPGFVVKLMEITTFPFEPTECNKIFNIVFFNYEKVRDEALKRRKQLKNTGFSIFEDMTSMNMKLINRLKNRDDIKNAWFSNEKVFGLLFSGKKCVFNLLMILMQNF